MALIQETENSPALHSNLFAATQIKAIVADRGLIAVNQGTLVAGTCLGRLTANGQLKAVDSGKTDGTQTIYAILAEDVVTPSSGSAVEAPIYLEGEFNENALTFGGTDDADDHRVKAREIGLIFKTNVPA